VGCAVEAFSELHAEAVLRSSDYKRSEAWVCFGPSLLAFVPIGRLGRAPSYLPMHNRHFGLLLAAARHVVVLVSNVKILAFAAVDLGPPRALHFNEIVARPAVALVAAGLNNGYGRA
jgi:hypothetical protein